MRLRLLVPRSGRGRGLGGLALAAAAAVVLLVVLPGDEERPSPPRPAPTPTPTPTPTPAPCGRRSTLPPPAPRWPSASPSRTPTCSRPTTCFRRPSRMGAWRDELARISPSCYRLVVDVEQGPAEPRRARRTWRCRTTAACATSSRARRTPALHDQLRALAARQRAAGRRWSSSPGRRSGRRVPPSGCPGEPRAAGRAPRDMRGLPRAGRPACSTLGRAEGAELRYLTPWNEPNHPYFLAPQRKACDALAPVARRRARTRGWRAPCGPSWPSTAAATRSSCSARWPASASRRSRATVVAGDDPRPAARARLLGAGVVAARLHRRHRPGRHGERRARRPAAARASTRSGSPRPASDRRRAASRWRAGSPARRRAAGCCTGDCGRGAPTRASRSPCSTRCARTTCSRPGSSPPTSRARGRRCASGRRGARASGPTRRRRRPTCPPGG